MLWTGQWMSIFSRTLQDEGRVSEIVLCKCYANAILCYVAATPFPSPLARTPLDYGGDSKVINLVTNYLSDRQQRVDC